jgi:hypothetical protein
MENLLSVLSYLLLGLILLVLDVWFVLSVRNAIGGGQIVIAPFEVVGQKDDDGKLGRSLALMLQAQLVHIQHDLEDVQNSSEAARASRAAENRLLTKSAPQIVFVPALLGERRAVVPVSILESPKIDVAVAGVQVGGVFPWLQRLMLKNRTLAFSIYFEGDRAVVAGSLDPFLHSKGNALWLASKSTPDEISENVAYALIQLKLASSQRSGLGALDLDEFKLLLTTLFQISELNKKSALGRSEADEFSGLVPKIDKLAVKIPRWDQLTLLKASLIDAAGKQEQAFVVYAQLHSSLEEKSRNRDAEVDPALKQRVEERYEQLAAVTEAGQEEAAHQEVPHEIIADESYAVAFFNRKFGTTLTVPPVTLLRKTDFNAYFGERTYSAAPGVRFIPDITYHEMAIYFLGNRFVFQGQAGALAISYADVFASWIKQERLGQTADHADWLIGEGFVAWMTGGDIKAGVNKSAIRSLKAPGTAYDDPVVGKDPQPSNMDGFVKTEQDSGGVHINSGIPSKAFYETAIRIGTDRAGQIWYQALGKLAAKASFQDLAAATLSAAEPGSEQETIRRAWKVVGINIGSPASARSGKPQS